MHHRNLQAVLLVAAALASTVAMGQGAQRSQPSAQRGHDFAQVLCAGCHLVGSTNQNSAVAGVPSFLTIANRPQQSAARLARILIKPHRPMPQLQLSRAEIDDLIAYFDALRRPDAGGPLLPRRAPAKRKPTYPSQS